MSGAGIIIAPGATQRAKVPTKTSANTSGDNLITVAILINGNPIMARSATNTLKETPEGHIYLCDDGSQIIHKRDTGAVALAIKLLETIKEKS